MRQQCLVIPNDIVWTEKLDDYLSCENLALGQNQPRRPSLSMYSSFPLCKNQEETQKCVRACNERC